MHYHHILPLRGENKTRKLNVNKVTQVKKTRIKDANRQLHMD